MKPSARCKELIHGLFIQGKMILLSNSMIGMAVMHKLILYGIGFWFRSQATSRIQLLSLGEERFYPYNFALRQEG